MRKIIAGLLTILTVLSLCGCGSTVAPPQSGRATTSKQTTESVTQASDTQAPTSEQPTETEAQTPSVPESLFLKYFDAEFEIHDKRYNCLSRDNKITRVADESTHQETVILELHMDFEYFTITREASIVYQYHSSDDIWEALNLDSNQRPEWSTAYEELHWDKMLGTWTKNEEYLQYTINIESIDLESMSFTCSYDIIESTWGTHHYTGSGTFGFERYSDSAGCFSEFRPDERRGSVCKVFFDRDGVKLFID